MAASRYALVNGYVLDGSADMKPREGLVVVVSDGKFEAVAPERELDLSGCVRIDLAGGYIMPGLVNMHVHLASAGKAPKPNAKPVDYKGLMDKLGKYRPVKHLFYKMAKKYAATELKSGVTTLRAVGGLFDIDGRVRDAVEAGKVAGPRIIAANTGVSVPGGHFAGSLATEATTPEEAAADVRRAVESGADIIKLMITGGVMDATARVSPVLCACPLSWSKLRAMRRIAWAKSWPPTLRAPRACAWLLRTAWTPSSTALFPRLRSCGSSTSAALLSSARFRPPFPMPSSRSR